MPDGTCFSLHLIEKQKKKRACKSRVSYIESLYTFLSPQLLHVNEANDGVHNGEITYDIRLLMDNQHSTTVARG